MVGQFVLVVAGPYLTTSVDPNKKNKRYELLLLPKHYFLWFRFLTPTGPWYLYRIIGGNRENKVLRSHWAFQFYPGLHLTVYGIQATTGLLLQDAWFIFRFV